jgi:lytic murein transglycosylase
LPRRFFLAGDHLFNGKSIQMLVAPMTLRFLFRAFAVSAFLTTPAASALAASCGTGSFDAWLTDFKNEAAAKGISQSAIASGLNGVTLDQAVLSRDRSQRVFSQSFEEFSGRMVPPRLARGASMMKQYGSVLARIEQSYGVPGEVLVAIWGLETDFGANIGKFPTIRSLATLAYDCRRSETFRAELMDALRIVQRGDLSPQEMRGAWAGELGQTQFMPSSYIKFAVDFDNNGRRDLLRSAPDVLASTANYLAGYGWQRGKDWEPGSANFAVLQQWNKSEVYAKTVASFASQLARAP